MKKAILVCVISFAVAGFAQASTSSVNCQTYGMQFAYGFKCSSQGEPATLLDSDNLPIRYTISVCKNQNDTSQTAATTLILQSIKGYAPKLLNSFSLLHNINSCNNCGGVEEWMPGTQVAGDFTDPFLGNLTAQFNPNVGFAATNYLVNVSVVTGNGNYSESCGEIYDEP